MNLLWPSDPIWWYKSGPTLTQMMACCLTAKNPLHESNLTSHSEALCHSHGSEFTVSAKATFHFFLNYTSKVIATTLRDQCLTSTIRCWYQSRIKAVVCAIIWFSHWNWNILVTTFLYQGVTYNHQKVFTIPDDIIFSVWQSNHCGMMARMMLCLHVMVT